MKKYVLLLLTMILCTILSATTIEKDDEDVISNEQEKSIIGTIESVYIDPGDITIKAKIDTGANTTSLDAQDLNVVTEDGVKYVTFTLYDKLIKSKILKFVRIKQHGGDSQRRPVIMMNITLGNVTQNVRVTLTDRSNFKYKMIVGVNFLYGHFIVDVSQQELTVPKRGDI